MAIKILGIIVEGKIFKANSTNKGHNNQIKRKLLLILTKMVREHLEFFLMKMLLEKIIQDPYVVVNIKIQL
jgi:hypothetical protein